MSLSQLSEHVYAYRGGVNLGIIATPNQKLILIDSGLDSSNARKALRPFLESGYQLAHIINTHSHADHIGGNNDLVKRTGCKVWAPARECPWIRWPELEPLGLYGAWPPPALQVKFLQAQPSPEVAELPTAPGTITLEGITLELIPTPGHALEQVAVAAEGVLFAADGLFAPETIEKHPVIFLVNVGEYLSSLTRIAGRPERHIVPGHGDWLDRSSGEGDPLEVVVQANRAAIGRLQEAILQALEVPLPQEELLSRVVHGLGKVLDSEPQYFLDRAAVSAHLSHLFAGSRIGVQYLEGRRLIGRTQRY
ncbi:MAG TPA: MBL fold metallo-hydrolase [Symbiobacteriaceae bacterium]|jgi:glyoxylase-like metal-dependent hydrolase (beta-lactamase superfamily II)